MVITFESSVFGDENHLYSINTELANGYVLIKNKYTSFINNNDNIELSVALNKKELHDFIGALLHLQSKLNQNK